MKLHTSPSNNEFWQACLHTGEFVVLRDFAENYSFTLLDDAQGYHCNSA
jgi:hypothetical protein